MKMLDKEYICCVVLHYQNNKDTIECVDSLLGLKVPNGYNTAIIIIDNNSPNGLFHNIEKYYCDNENVVCIHSSENLGFAKGNNIGFKIAKYQFNAKYIVCSNNDIIVKDKDLFVKMVEYYKNTYFHICGPQIISLVDGKFQNPVKKQYYSKNDIYKRIIKYTVLLGLSYFGLDTYIQNFYTKCKVQKCGNDSDNNYQVGVLQGSEIDQNDYQLHGAFLIFSEKYISLFDGFYDETFMYQEENILKYRCIKHKLTMKYCDAIFVSHKEGAATNAIAKSAKTKRQFYYRNNIISCKILIQLIEKDNEMI